MKYVPNTITIVRLLASVAVVLLMAYGFEVAACVTLLLAALSDAVDGAIARRWHVESQLGKILEPIADMALTICSLIGLLVTGAWPLWVIAPLIGAAAILQTIGWSKPTSTPWIRVKRVQAWLHPLLFVMLLAVIVLWYILIATSGNLWLIGLYVAAIIVLAYVKRGRLADFRPT